MIEIGDKVRVTAYDYPSEGKVVGKREHESGGSTYRVEFESKGSGPPLAQNFIDSQVEPLEEDEGGPISRGGTDRDEDPKHYSLFGGERETMELIRDRTTAEGFRGYLYGNAIKYLMRWRHKHDDRDDQVADLKKARVYLDLLIEDLL